MSMLWRGFCRLDGAMRTVIVSIAGSLLLWLFVLAAGFQTAPAHAPAAYRPYFSIHNWWPYPFFFAALALPLWLTWEPMLAAWRKLAVTGVLKRGEIAASAEDAHAVAEQIRSLRRAAVGAAAVFALLVGALDARAFLRPYSGQANAGEQAAFACKERNAFAKWLFEAGTEVLPRTMTPCAAPLQI